MGAKPKKVRVLNKITKEETVYNNAVEAAHALNRSYCTITWWISGRVRNPIYTAEYIKE